MIDLMIHLLLLPIYAAVGLVVMLVKMTTEAAGNLWGEGRLRCAGCGQWTTPGERLRSLSLPECSGCRRRRKSIQASLRSARHR